MKKTVSQKIFITLFQKKKKIMLEQGIYDIYQTPLPNFCNQKIAYFLNSHLYFN